MNIHAADTDRQARRAPARTDHRSGSLKEMLEHTEREILREYSNQYRTTQQLADALDTSQPTIVRKLKKYKLRGPNN